MPPRKADSLTDVIAKLKTHLQNSTNDLDASELYPYGRVTAAEARAQEKVKHEAAVVILLAPIQERLSALFIKRSAHGIHGRQIAFPGGKRDEGESFETTAIRELYEETGILISQENIVSRLNEVFIVPSLFVVQPYVAIIETTPTVTPNLEEIDAVFWSDIATIQKTKARLCKVISSVGNHEIKVHGFMMNNEIIWGATAIILEDFKNRVRKISSAL